MKWFKHMTLSSQDEKLAQVINKFGMEGYGVYWRLLELIAQQLDDTSSPAISYPPKVLVHNLWITCGKLLTFLHFFTEIGLLSVKFTQKTTKRQPKDNQKIKKDEKKANEIDTLSTVESVLISAPNLLKFRDNYTQRKGYRQKNNYVATTNKVSLEREGEEEEEKRERERDARALSSFSFSSPLSRALLSNFKSTPEHAKIAKNLNIDLKNELNKFLDYFLANGEEREDWNKVFRNWLKRAGGSFK